MSAGRPVRRAGTAAGLGLLAAGFCYYALRVGGVLVPFWQLWLIATATLLIYPMVRGLGEPAEPLSAVPPTTAGSLAEPYRQVERWERRLATTYGDPGWFARVVHTRLTALVAERLRQRHGVALAADPERARHLLGDELCDYLAAPPDRTPDPARLSRLTTRMEEI